MGIAHRSFRKTTVAGIVALVIGFSALGALGVAQGQTTPVRTAAAAGYNGEITRTQVIDRARTWLGTVWYSQTACYQQGQPPCQVPSYRQDCSGYVSMAWNLGFSRYTGNLTEVMTTIPRQDLKPGDVLFRRDNSVQHVALFVRWADGGRPVVWEEYSTGHTAEERTWSASWAGTFQPYRYNNIRDDAPPPPRPRPSDSPKPSDSPASPPAPSDSPESPLPSDSASAPPSPVTTTDEPSLPVTGSGSAALLGGFGGTMLLLGTGLLLASARPRYRGVRRRPA